MSKFRFVLAFAIAAASGSAFAAPVPGSADYETLYNTVFTDCTVPDGSVAACRIAIIAYSDRLVADAATVTDDQALSSFRALRSEVFTANTVTPLEEADEAFRTAIDALFEEIIPESGAVGEIVSDL